MDAVRSETPAAYGLCRKSPASLPACCALPQQAVFSCAAAGIQPLRRSACRTVRGFYNTLRRMVDPPSKALVCACLARFCRAARCCRISPLLLGPLNTIRCQLEEKEIPRAAVDTCKAPSSPNRHGLRPPFGRALLSMPVRLLRRLTGTACGRLSVAAGAEGVSLPPRPPIPSPARFYRERRRDMQRAFVKKLRACMGYIHQSFETGWRLEVDMV